MLPEGPLDDVPIPPDEQSHDAQLAFPDDSAIRKHMTAIEALCVQERPHFGLIWAFHSDKHTVDQGHLLYTTYYPWSGEEASMPMLVAAHWLWQYEGMDCTQMRNVIETAPKFRVKTHHVPDVESAAHRICAIYAELEDMYAETLNPDAAEPWTGAWFAAVEIPLELHQHMGSESHGIVKVMGEGESAAYPALAIIRETLQNCFAYERTRTQDRFVDRQRRDPDATVPDAMDLHEDGEDLEGVSDELRAIDRYNDAVDDLFVPSESDDADDDAE